MLHPTASVVSLPTEWIRKKSKFQKSAQNQNASNHCPCFSNNKSHLINASKNLVSKIKQMPQSLDDIFIDFISLLSNALFPANPVLLTLLNSCRNWIAVFWHSSSCCEYDFTKRFLSANSDDNCFFTFSNSSSRLKARKPPKRMHMLHCKISVGRSVGRLVGQSVGQPTHLETSK